MKALFNLISQTLEKFEHESLTSPYLAMNLALHHKKMKRAKQYTLAYLNYRNGECITLTPAR